ncbi:MAG: YcjX family protein [Rhizobiales bacterium]|nr:YcjX family protein [Hyphomicrobiales bacterium]
MGLASWTAERLETARDLVRPTVRLGVTGLSRSGKTVFITALVHNLLDGGWLPFFEPVAQGRLKAVVLMPPPYYDDLFAYERYIRALTGRPAGWPERTDSVSELRLRLTYEPRAGLLAFLGERTLDVEIVDYPGEWLLDLALLERDYLTWSREAFILAAGPARRSLAARFLAFIESIEPDGPFSSDTAYTGSALFRDYLKACREDRHALSTLPPGRFLEPGRDAEKPLMNFFPLPLPNDERPRPARGGAVTLRDQLDAWYEAYKREYVKPFFRDHFSRLDRQIVLVDVLKALNAGPDAIEDLERAVSSILPAFRQGSGNWLTRLFSPRIDRVMFAATKADHLHATGYDRLERIMGRIVERARARARDAGAEVGALAIASVRATRQAVVTRDGETLRCIAGVPMAGETIDGKRYDGRTEAVIYPGTLPEDPDEALRSRRNIRFVRFLPPPLEPGAGETGGAGGRGGGATLPHIRLDRALQFLIGDKLA